MLSTRTSPDAAADDLEAWKRAFRVLHHEISNTLGPVASLARTGRVLLAREGREEQLALVLATIADRATHLGAFLSSYADLARVPAPRRAPVVWRELLAGISLLTRCRYELARDVVRTELDRSQVEQALLHLIRNASEAGSAPEEIEVAISGEGEGVRVFVRDRGPGMDGETLRKATLPFFSTKSGGTGLGLAIAREIAQNHGGELFLRNRDHGGLEVELWFPATERQRGGDSDARRARPC